MEEAIIKWTDNDWQTMQETKTKNSGLGIHLADIATENKHSEKIIFTFFWEKSQKWENKNFEVGEKCQALGVRFQVLGVRYQASGN